jgi:SAM-dependent methyltransferase
VHSLSVIDPGQTNGERLNVDAAVRERYSAASREAKQELCCPIDYEARYLAVLPPELIEKDYGCGDPSRYLRSGERVLDLGSGGGKVCYIASQVVGAGGQVIGVDANDDMLALSRKYQREIGDRLGYHNVSFHKGRIQDLALDLEVFEAYLAEKPVRGVSDWLRAAEHADHLRHTRPMIPNDSIDVVVSNCVLNLVRREERRQLIAEIFRVLRPGGRAVISDVTCDEPVPEHLQQDPTLWTGCISGAFLEHEFLGVFAAAGFYGMRVLDRMQDPWATIAGIEFRSMTVEAFKRSEGPRKDYKQAVIYRGPWKSVTDDEGRVLQRGVRTAVCGKTFETYTDSPYSESILAVPPHKILPDEQAAEFDVRRSDIRHPRETKGLDYDKTDLPGKHCCGPDGCG